MSERLLNIREYLEELAPLQAAESWDNPGLLLGMGEKPVSTVYIALDATVEGVERAIEEGAELMLTHHPVIFKGIKSINDMNGQGAKLMKILKGGLSVYSMHTNFDSCPGGMADIVCERLGLKKLCPLDGGQAFEAGYGIGFIAELKERMSPRELSLLVKERFGLPFVQLYDAKREIKRLACCPGSGRSELSAAIRARADAFITGDMGHHEGLDCIEEGISLIDAGHYGLEHIFVQHMAKLLRERFPGIRVIEEPIKHTALIL